MLFIIGPFKVSEVDVTDSTQLMRIREAPQSPPPARGHSPHTPGEAEADRAQNWEGTVELSRLPCLLVCGV